MLERGDEREQNEADFINDYLNNFNSYFISLSN